MSNPFETGLPRNPANYTPLSPITFLTRTAFVHPQRTSVIHGNRRWTWAETYIRCCRLASALTKRGIGKGDTVSVMAPNIPAIFEAHFGVLMTGAVLNTLNIRLETETLANIFEHAETKVLLTDREFSPQIKDALAKVNQKILVIDIDDPETESGDFLGEIEYEAFLAEGNPEFEAVLPEDDWQAVSLNYTSGTTGTPKGVVYHTRGAYLLASGNVMAWEMPHRPVYLWTLPMFHCNGWCFPWTITMLAGTHVCLRKVSAKNIYDSIAEHQVTHLCGAPIVMNMICNAPVEEQQELPHKVEIMTAAAPPPPTVIAQMEEAGFNVTHVYGLTEVYGPAVVCEWQQSWAEKDKNTQAQLKGRQGVRYHVLEGLMVADPETMKPVPADAETMGEVMMQGNIVMKGYLKNPEETKKAFAGGWFHSGDLGVLHPDGYIELKDRSKDIIISGGENISSVEIENVLYQHPEILEAAVVARPDEKWGETPCAFVVLKPGAVVNEQQVLEFCRSKLAGYKIPKKIVFSELPKTSTGKIRKSVLREQAKKL
ncbi:MAG TPA: acyl-CoA synthetase [Candidatus Lambdaproteobacteria bacterium]|nr:acyl-CoA synthetase [SAR324 cluster bacterium]HBL55409.1 acyl-CoA synthetase [Deltaproteobacteria bacterium]HHZ77802.1 acyl-CoA synthetase [Candidatus Lambdaproteobacteria bacterium]HIA56847.1 acyl-CoA synthetase [Candidatus Lambdaproteobacteria bacterium]HIB46108.1 acyl-CoA synthetase [Candidatus Lambdaproteobacteria bacterium]